MPLKGLTAPDGWGTPAQRSTIKWNQILIVYLHDLGANGIPVLRGHESIGRAVTTGLVHELQDLLPVGLLYILALDFSLSLIPKYNELSMNHLLVNDPIAWFVVRHRGNLIKPWVLSIKLCVSLLPSDGLEHWLVALLVEHQCFLVPQIVIDALAKFLELLLTDPIILFILTPFVLDVRPVQLDLLVGYLVGLQA